MDTFKAMDTAMRTLATHTEAMVAMMLMFPDKYGVTNREDALKLIDTCGRLLGAVAAKVVMDGGLH